MHANEFHFESSFFVHQPIAAGSGIPEIKCYLNGVKVGAGQQYLNLY